MNLNKLFELIDGMTGDVSEFLGLAFKFDHGIVIIDYVNDYEYVLEDGSTEIVSGYVIDFVPFDDLQEPASYFALDEEGLKYIISDFILE